MKQYFKFVVTAALTLAISGVAQAKENDDDEKACSDSTLRGLYVFTASGFNIVSGAAQPKAIVEVITFNGDGTLTVPAATVSINGVIGRSPPGGTGSYTVEPDCTGSLKFGTAVSPGPKYDLFVAFKGSEIQNDSDRPGAPVFRNRRTSIALTGASGPRRRNTVRGLLAGTRHSGAVPITPAHHFPGEEIYRRSTRSFLISAIALAGLRFFGQVRVQFMIVWQR